jgi:heptosyltransferase I
MRILVVKTTSMGDVVHTLPAITDIAKAHPGAVIDWLVEAPFAAIPALHPAVRRVLPIAWRKWRKSLRNPATRAAIGQLRADLQAEHYDLVIDFQGLLKSVLWAVQAHGPRAGYDWHSIREPLASLFYQRRAAVARELHAVDRNRQLAAAHLGHALAPSPPDFGLRAPTPQWQPPSPYAVLIPCASRPEKLWPESDWQAVLAQVLALHWTPVILWGSAQEQALAQRIAHGSTAVVPPFLSVGDTAAVLAGAQLVVGLDTGFSHLAAAFGRPTVGIYCDHEPGLAGVTGAGFVRSLGGKNQVPSRADVLEAFKQALAHVLR